MIFIRHFLPLNLHYICNMRVGKHFLPRGGYESPQSASGEYLILRCWGVVPLCVSCSDRDNRPFCLVVEEGQGQAWRGLGHRAGFQVPACIGPVGKHLCPQRLTSVSSVLKAPLWGPRVRDSDRPYGAIIWLVHVLPDSLGTDIYGSFITLLGRGSGQPEQRKWGT